MKLLRAFFDFYLNASIHVALAVISLMGVTAILLDIQLNSSLVGFTFFGTMVCYNFIKYGVEAEKYLIVSNAYHKSIQVFSFLCFVPAMYFFFHLERQLWWGIMGLGLISVLYAIPLLPKTKNLRSLGGSKVYVVALVWTGFTVLLPVLEQKIPLSWDVWILLVQRFILVLALILPFEIRDLKWDSLELRTLPQVLGVEKTRRLGIFLMILFLMLTFLKDEIHELELATRFVVTLLMGFVFLNEKRMQQPYFASFWVEAVPIIWVGMLLLGKVF